MTSLWDFSNLHHTSLGPPGILTLHPGQDAQGSMSPSPTTSALGNLRLVELNSSNNPNQAVENKYRMTVFLLGQVFFGESCKTLTFCPWVIKVFTGGVMVHKRVALQCSKEIQDITRPGLKKIIWWKTTHASLHQIKEWSSLVHQKWMWHDDHDVTKTNHVEIPFVPVTLHHPKVAFSLS